MEINKEELRVWIAALRSGKYSQTRGRLQNENGYCCLGVACKVLIPIEKQILSSTGFLVGGMPKHQQDAPEWLNQIDDDVKQKKGQSLTELNDYNKFTFSQIADLLEKYYLT
jgi:hypothetical protein